MYACNENYDVIGWEGKKKTNFNKPNTYCLENEGRWPPFDAICILAFEILERIGFIDPPQWQIDAAESMVKTLLLIMGREAKFFTMREVEDKLIAAQDVIFDKQDDYKEPLPKIKIVPCNEAATIFNLLNSNSVQHPEHTDTDVTFNHTRKRTHGIS